MKFDKLYKLTQEAEEIIQTKDKQTIMIYQEEIIKQLHNSIMQIENILEGK
jgi:hypothetical protein